MDDILASIRRIMLDEQARLQDGPGTLAYAAGRSQVASPDAVLILDSSMVVEAMPVESLDVTLAEETVIMISADEEIPPEPMDFDTTLDAREAIVTGIVPADAATADAPFQVAHDPEASAQTTVLGAAGAMATSLDPVTRQVVVSPQAMEALMAPAAAAAAAASVDALLKQLSEERFTAFKPAASPSPTLDEVVRSELRPFLKAWLDEHLPAMVEHLVRVEITRLIGRSGA